MSEANSQLKERVREFWQEHPCGTKFADAEPGSRNFYELVEAHRYAKEWHIPAAAGFAQTTNLDVLEIGCGLGTDGAQFAQAGARYTGIDLTDAAVNLARRRFELFNLPGSFRVADAERLDFPNDSFDLVYSHGVLHHTPDTAAAGFANTKDLDVLEIGCGLGTDGAQFAQAGARYTGIDLTDAAIDLARRRFELFNLPGTFRVADAEQLDFPDNTFDLVYSHGVLHHTPDTAAAVREIHRVLRPGGRAVVMLYHRNSYNYRINIAILRRAGVHLLRWNAGVKLVHTLTGESEESLREHAQQLRSDSHYLSSNEFLSRNTDGAGNPLARVYSRREARELFKDFATVELRPYFLNKRWLPILGPLLPRPLEAKLASRWGWHLWIYAKK